MAFGALLGQTASGGSGKRVCRFTVGTSTAGWTANDCDYLCDGTDDQVEINAAIRALPAEGGEIVILDGTYNITATIAMNKDNVTLSGNGNSTILKRMWNSSHATQPVIFVSPTNGGCCVTKLNVDGNKNIYNSTFNFGIYLYKSKNNTVISNNCSNNKRGIFLGISVNNIIASNICNDNEDGIFVNGDNNTITGNTCIRGTGQSSDYTSSQYTIYLYGTNNNYNLISSNNIMGKTYISDGGTSNTFVNNKYN